MSTNKTAISKVYVEVIPTIKVIPEIDRVIYNNPATVVFWVDGTKTVVKCNSCDKYDPEKGLMAAVCKRAMGDGYYKQLREHIPDFIYRVIKKEES